MSSIRRETTGRRIGPGGRLLPFKHHCEDLGYCVKTGDRRAKTDPDFPDIVWINERRYISEDAHILYKQKLIQRGLGAKTRLLKFACGPPS